MWGRITGVMAIARRHDAQFAARLAALIADRYDAQARVPAGQHGGGQFASSSGGGGGPSKSQERRAAAKSFTNAAVERAIKSGATHKQVRAIREIEHRAHLKVQRASARLAAGTQQTLFQKAPKQPGSYRLSKAVGGGTAVGIANKALVHAAAQKGLAEHAARVAGRKSTPPAAAAGTVDRRQADRAAKSSKTYNHENKSVDQLNNTIARNAGDIRDHGFAMAKAGLLHESADKSRAIHEGRDLPPAGLNTPEHAKLRAKLVDLHNERDSARAEFQARYEHPQHAERRAAHEQKFGPLKGDELPPGFGPVRKAAAAPAAAPAAGSLADQWRAQGAQRRAADLAKAAKAKAIEAGANPHLGKAPAQLDRALESNAKKLSDVNFRIGTSSGMHETPEQALTRFRSLPVSMGPRKLADEHAALTRERGHLHEAAAAHGGVNEYNKVNTPARQRLKTRGEAAGRKAEAENAAHEAKQKADREAAAHRAVTERDTASKAAEQASFQASRDAERARERMKHDHSQKSAAQINKQIERASAKQSANSSKMIAAGLGHETAHETADIHMGRREAPAGLNNPGHQALRAEHVRLSDERFFLHAEVARRAGPGMSRLPRGFGPIGGSTKRKKSA